MDTISSGWPKYIRDVPDDVKPYFKFKNELTVQNGLVFRNDRIITPFSLRKVMVGRVHIAHDGIEYSIKLAKNNIFWPGMSTQIAERVRECSICAKYATSQAKLPMMSHQIPLYAWQIVSMDILFVKHESKQCRVLVIADHYSDYFDVYFLKDMTSESVIKSMKISFSHFGVPGIVCSDNSMHFANRAMQVFAEKSQFQHITSSPYINRVMERENQLLK